MFGLLHRGELDGTVENEFEHLSLRIKHLWLVEHNEDGTHRQEFFDFAASEHTHDAEDIVSGELHVDRIPNLDASKITSGALDKARQHAQTAFKDEANTFTADQTINGKLTASGVIHSNSVHGFAIGNIGGVPRISHSAGTFTIINSSDAIADVVANTYFERNRSVAIGEWVYYTAVEDSGVSALGNGSLSGRYTLVGKTCHFWIRLIVGSTTTFSGSNLRFALPLTASGSTAFYNVNVAILDSSSGLTHHGVGVLFDTNRINASIAGFYLTNVFPDLTLTPRANVAFATNDQIVISGTLEIA